MGRQWLYIIAFIILATTACTDSATDRTAGADLDAAIAAPAVDIAAIPTGEVRDFGVTPDPPAGGWGPDILNSLTTVVEAVSAGTNPTEEWEFLAETNDPRLAWALSDMLRFVQVGEVGESIQSTIRTLTGLSVDPLRPWNDTVETLIAWDLPVPDGYFTFKRDFFSRLDSRWEPLFTEGTMIDWRHVSWGGVQIDDRPAGSTATCRCIPALDDPAVTTADGGDWYPDERLVFGIVIDDEARAYPKNIMEVHEMVNDSVGGRRIAIPYCTLCGSAQAYLTDELGDGYEQPVFRTSGLLIRSNKMMYELTTQSFIDTFLGEATSGPMAEAGITFDQVSVVTTTWGDWKQAHPDTTIVAEDGGIGRTYDLDPLRGRDDDGPIFPVGAVDPRLPVHEAVLGVLDGDGSPVAFHVATAVEILEGGAQVIVGDVELLLDAGGLRAVRADASDAEGHQAFWFAWSQFHPDTALWPHDFQDQGS